MSTFLSQLFFCRPFLASRITKKNKKKTDLSSFQAVVFSSLFDVHHHLCILLFWIINRETKLNFMWAIKNWESNQWALKQTRPIVNKCHKHWLCKQWFRSVWYMAAGLPLVSENHTRRAASYTSTAEKNLTIERSCRFIALFILFCLCMEKRFCLEGSTSPCLSIGIGDYRFHQRPFSKEFGISSASLMLKSISGCSHGYIVDSFRLNDNFISEIALIFDMFQVF